MRRRYRGPPTRPATAPDPSTADFNKTSSETSDGLDDAMHKSEKAQKEPPKLTARTRAPVPSSTSRRVRHRTDWTTLCTKRAIRFVVAHLDEVTFAKLFSVIKAWLAPLLEKSAAYRKKQEREHYEKRWRMYVVCQRTASTSQELKAAAVEFNRVLERLDRLAIDDRGALNNAETRRDQAKTKYDNYLMEMKGKHPKEWIAAAPKVTVPAPPAQPANGPPALHTPPVIPRDPPPPPPAEPDEVVVEPDPVGDPFQIRVHASSERVEAFSWVLIG
ncbi:unnamed protein product, partial [Mesorhabditis spiculigera]